MIAFGHRLHVDEDLWPDSPGARDFEAPAPGRGLRVERGELDLIEGALERRLESESPLPRALTLWSDADPAPGRAGVAYVLEVEGAGRFGWRVGADTIAYHPAAAATPALLGHVLLHSVLPLWATLEDEGLVLHAAGVVVDGRATLLVAPSHGGKSTLVAELVGRGLELLSDDVVLVREEADPGGVGDTGREGLVVVGGAPFLRPWREPAEQALFVETFAVGPVPLGRVVVLGPVDPIAPVVNSPISGAEAFRAIRGAVHTQIDALAARDFALAARLADRAEVRRMAVPWDLGRRCEVADQIVVASS